MRFNTLKKISYVILSIAALNIYSFMVLHVAEGGRKLGGPISDALYAFAEFPRTVINVFTEIERPEIYMEKHEIHEVNELPYDLFAVNGRYERSKWIISLKNLRNDSTLHDWYIYKSDYNKTDREFSHSEPRSPIILEDMSVIASCDESYNLFRIDKESNIIWHNTDYQFHHALNRGADGNIWTCTRKIRSNSLTNTEYWDNFITKIDWEDGKMLLHKSITDILVENGYTYLVHGIGNVVNGKIDDDPLHLNDIEPVMSDGPYWKKGDLFLSLRHRSLIFLYRPSTNKVIRLIQGPFLMQHDIDIQSDSTISLFNNNTSGLRKVNSFLVDKTVINKNPYGLNQYSGVMLYNFADSSFTEVTPEKFKSEKLYTRTEGVHRILKSGDLFVECQNEGTIYVFNADKTYLRKYYNPSIGDLLQPPHWIRIYESLNFEVK